MGSSVEHPVVNTTLKNNIAGKDVKMSRKKPDLEDNNKSKKSRKIKDKFVEEREVLPITKIHLTGSQTHVANMLKEFPLCFVEGKSGSGKTMAVLHTFCKMYLEDYSKNILIIRTPVEAGDDKVGYLPSGIDEKLEPHFHSTKKILIQLLGRQKVECDLNKRIHFSIPNYILGDTLDNSLILLDEVQQISPKTTKLLLERIGQNSICAAIGDKTQMYVNDKKRNGLSDAITRFFDEDMKAKFPMVGYFKFPKGENQRSEIAAIVNEAYEEME